MCSDICFDHVNKHGKAIHCVSRYVTAHQLGIEYIGGSQQQTTFQKHVCKIMENVKIVEFCERYEWQSVC